ncbi:hypothetical protein [Blastococcus goldschmidtiae]|uniref:Uncharacterized protein n=1 Tax=Blastococcus goldschmidtiae TaxID=3075546 RepID=A0ABU2K960_9ACTN|nr:hypothetical protein [Blastococcus sp. DSM 46792]MDT0276722.1 hypothetical protein [Blastococcus sp. DSM 46792]
MTAVIPDPSAQRPPGGRAPFGLRQRAMMLLPVVLPLMIYALIRIGDSSRTGLVVCGALLAALAVGSLVLARRRGAEVPEG